MGDPNPYLEFSRRCARSFALLFKAGEWELPLWRRLEKGDTTFFDSSLRARVCTYLRLAGASRRQGHNHRTRIAPERHGGPGKKTPQHAGAQRFF